ncbi:MAG: UPF0280 family protein [Candidatus Omnitrophica bacterium]|nr:UPF0280 family protein [Candidatus Omnitrophota bacterium]MCM8777039.1 UPF0280 family protein [Candidatus Omnitrophota bacterium]
MRKNVERERFYREFSKNAGLKKFQVRVEETDLLVLAERNLKIEIEKEVIKQRDIIKSYIKHHPEFYTSFSPVSCESEEEIIKLMCESAMVTETGPMASVAGAIAEIVGLKMLLMSNQILIENGGDIFVKMDREFTVGVYAGSSPLSLKIGLVFPGRTQPFGIATSSGTVGHSFSYGKADAVTVVSSSATFSDGAATYFGNLIKGDHIEQEKIETELKKFPFIEGLFVIKGKEIFLWGDIELKKLS